jgi:hypothetical protein
MESILKMYLRLRYSDNKFIALLIPKTEAKRVMVLDTFSVITLRTTFTVGRDTDKGVSHINTRYKVKPTPDRIACIAKSHSLPDVTARSQ